MAQREGEVFGARLRELREQRGETQRSLAELIGSTHPYISQMERGLKVPSLTTIVRLAIALRCKVTDLVGVFNKHDLAKLVPPRK
jgi:transcriptional regulator with XRE-family HTH domain